MSTDPHSPEMITELIAAIIALTEIETYENDTTFKARAEELNITFLANAVAALRDNKDLYDRIFKEDNPHMQLLRAHIEATNTLVD